MASDRTDNGDSAAVLRRFCGVHGTSMENLENSTVRPVLKSKRNVVILRDLPDDSTEAEIMALLRSGPYGENVVSVKPEVNNTWFLKFNVDDGAQDVVLWLRSQSFKGKPVNAAIKSEHFLRSFFPVNQSMGFMPPGLPPMDEGPGFGGKGGFDLMPPPGMQSMGMGPEAPMMESLPMQFGLQCPGFWKPWGSRHRPAPLDISEEPVGKGKSKGKEEGKGKGKGKVAKSGKWNSPEEPPGYRAKGRMAWHEEPNVWEVSRDQDLKQEEEGRRKADGKAPKMKWAVKSEAG
ncbi:unnamed protein product [Effrenium voratum]|uniref:LARP4/4B RNA recognition motif domain-containing protein n=1 Tax=Effrenium voratum TaxID=2562239 RepID=A0AA36HNE4_9DINO|nr:unnamed protein product [Effrenium voratum]